ncbi:PAS domain S-box protein [Roseofilum sp. BLCC_M154]|uniref:histidine kinase n=1 Tax=Roseofilum acuticapitatum BLCC-M154 TaxID=3022444 RepID=A0ABT7ANM2_9CYAN|nr:PAS domain S-box protein [Roseofilum acuticapitatum]MDJ1168498.1 PAS domain S-box protein [Roseofilum acuticapitatum BLCC-M154]
MTQFISLIQSKKAFRLLITFLFFIAPIATVAGFIYTQEIKQAKTLLEIQATNSLKGQTDQISREFQLVVSDLRILAELNELQTYLAEITVEQRNALAREFFHFSVHKELYDQIRFLDETGLENVRVNFNAGQPSIVPVEKLQNKGNRYYFQDAWVLSAGEIFVSPFDLNMEKGKIEQPLKPMIRFGMPVFDRQGEKRGIVLLNYLGKPLLTALKKDAIHAPGELMLLNAEGFWLTGVSASQLWGFMYRDRQTELPQTFAEQFPQEWQRISQERKGQFYTTNGLFTFVTIYPLVEGQRSSTGASDAFSPSELEIGASEYYWKVVSYVPTEEIQAILLPIGQKITLPFLLLAAIVLVLSIGLTDVQVKHRNAELKIEAQNRFLNNVINSLGDSFYVIDVTNYKIVTANTAAKKLGTVNHTTCYTLTHKRNSPCSDDMDQAHPCPLEILRKTKEPTVVEHTHFDAQGNPLIVEVHAYPILDIQGNLVQMIEYSLDITARRKAEEQVRKLSQAVEQSANGILITDLKGRIEYVNSQFTEMTGYTVQEVLGKTPRILNSGEQSKEYYQELWQTIQSGNEWRGEFHNQRKDGSLYWAHATISPIFNADQKITHFLGIQENITARKQAESDLRESEYKLRQQTQELEKTLAELRQAQSQLIQTEKMSSLGQLVAGIAHEINNPVSFIYGNLGYAESYIKDLMSVIEAYQESYPDPEQRVAETIEEMDLEFLSEDLSKILESMKEGANRIDAIVSSLRTFSHIDQVGIKAVDIHQGLDSTLTLLQCRLQGDENRREIQLKKQYGKLPLVECYPDQLHQVFMNLIMNAIDAIEERDRSSDNVQSYLGEISIITRTIGDRSVQISIIDNGIGIKESIKPRLFDPFFTTKDVGQGTGLGLSISYQIITEQHQGTIECLSKVSEGIEWVITLPVQMI